MHLIPRRNPDVSPIHLMISTLLIAVMFPVFGFGLVQALGRLDVDPLPLGISAETRLGDRVVVGQGESVARAAGDDVDGVTDVKEVPVLPPDLMITKTVGATTVLNSERPTPALMFAGVLRALNGESKRFSVNFAAAIERARTAHAARVASSHTASDFNVADDPRPSQAA